jgi:hypothetical protein
METVGRTAGQSPVFDNQEQFFIAMVAAER